MNKVINIMSYTLALAVNSRPNNASKDIKRANKIIATAQTNKLSAKTGITGDKTDLDNKNSDSYNMYMTTSTTYNTIEAISQANLMAARVYKKFRANMVYLLLIVILCQSIITMNFFPIVLSLCVVITDSIGDIFPNHRIFYMLSLLTTFNIYMTIVNVTINISEYYIQDSTTRLVRSAIYLILICMTILI